MGWDGDGERKKRKVKTDFRTMGNTFIQRQVVGETAEVCSGAPLKVSTLNVGPARPWESGLSFAFFAGSPF